MRTCSIPGCDRKHQAKGWCGTHYSRWKRGRWSMTAVSVPRGGPRGPFIALDVLAAFDEALAAGLTVEDALTECHPSGEPMRARALQRMAYRVGRVDVARMMHPLAHEERYGVAA